MKKATKSELKPRGSPQTVIEVHGDYYAGGPTSISDSMLSKSNINSIPSGADNQGLLDDKLLTDDAASTERGTLVPKQGSISFSAAKYFKKKGDLALVEIIKNKDTVDRDEFTGLILIVLDAALKAGRSNSEKQRALDDMYPLFKKIWDADVSVDRNCLSNQQFRLFEYLMDKYNPKTLENPLDVVASNHTTYFTGYESALLKAVINETSIGEEAFVGALRIVINAVVRRIYWWGEERKKKKDIDKLSPVLLQLFNKVENIQIDGGDFSKPDGRFLLGYFISKYAPKTNVTDDTLVRIIKYHSKHI